MPARRRRPAARRALSFRNEDVRLTRLRVIAVPNDYFGSDIVVAGLMTGRDALAVRDQIKGQFVIIPSAAFKSDEPVILDGTTREELQNQLGLPLHVLDFDGVVKMLGS